ncbi:hypothetical protein [Hymenobacter negativus]|uniref:Uncharacterized protein n=1 Tax=Hymenobacter negativus TaxID=2795026 RepID=A0ABS3QFZ0_9BACT|nr:hypothetical protein [Hymenobacter negativus]MBO2009903.1 hypothetical protein [Hymenobacter negativus]
MSALPPLLTEGLPIRRLGIVAQATATIWRDDNDPQAATKPESYLVPVTFPAQIPLEGGWRLQHASPTTGQLVTDNALVDLFHSSDYQNIRLNTFSLYNIGLLESIAAAFTDQPVGGLVSGSLGAVDGTILLPGGSPHLHYYRPQEAPHEQYLLLYTNRFAPGERPNEVPSYADLYALVQVELDEERFVFLLRQALDAARVARRQR